MPQSHVGLVGLGAVGQIFCSHLLERFSVVHVFDLDERRLAAAAETGAAPADSAADLGSRCDQVVVSLPNPTAVRAALLGGAGLIAGAHRGCVVLDTSTVSPETSREVYTAALDRGVRYLDAPVSGGEPLEGGVDGARAASMTFMVGGDADAFDAARPLMAALGRFFFHLGASGSGSTVKLISNLCSGIYALVAAEAFALGESCGYAPERLLEVFQHTDAKSFFMTDYLAPRLLAGNVTPGFSVELQLKDHRLAAELGHDHRVPLPMNAAAAQIWEAIRAQGRGGNDVTDAILFAAEHAGRGQTP